MGCWASKPTERVGGCVSGLDTTSAHTCSTPPSTNQSPTIHSFTLTIHSLTCSTVFGMLMRLVVHSGVLKSGQSSFNLRVTQVKAALASGGDAFRLYTRQPHQASAAMLLAYAADKPVEPVEVSGDGGGPVKFQWQD